MAPPDPAALPVQDPTKKKPRSLDEILSGLDATSPDGKSARSLDDILKSLGDTGPAPAAGTQATGVARDTGDVDLAARQEAAQPKGFFERAADFMAKDRAPATKQALQDFGQTVKEGVLHPIDTAESLAKATFEPAISAARPLAVEQTTPEAPRAFGSATTGAPEPFELQQRALDPGITGREKLIGTAGTVGMVIAGPMEGKMANALVARWGGELAGAAIRTMGVRRAYQLGIVGGEDIAKIVGAHTIASSVAGAEAGAMMSPEQPVQGALTGAVAGPILRGAGAAARGASRELGIAASTAAERIRAARAPEVPPRTVPETNADRLIGNYPERPARPAATATTPPAPEPTEPDYTVEPVAAQPLERRATPRAEGDVWTPEQRAAYVQSRQGAFARRMNKPWSQWTDAEKDAYFADVEEAKTEARTATGPPPAQAPAPAANASPEVVRVRTSDIYRDPERFQFKQGLGEEGVSRELKGTQKYNPQLAGVIGTWIDPANGKEYVVNGHHRDELAKRTGYPYQNAMRIQAKTPEEARSIGALMNIAEGRGTPVDVAKFLRDTKLAPAELERQGISLRGDLARKGMAISRLAPDVFAKVAAEEIPIGHAVQLGEMLPDQPELQREALKAISSSGQRLTESEVKEVARQVRDAGSEAVNQDTLFGTETEQKPLYVERGRVAANLLKKLSTDRRVLGFVAGKGRPEVLSKAGNKIDVERSKAMADQSSQLEEVFQRLYTRGGPIANLLTEAARKVASGQNIKSVSDELYPAVTEAIRQAIPRGGGAPGTHGEVPERPEPLAPSAPTEGEPDEVKPYTSSDEAQGGIFERGPKYGDNANSAALRSLWDEAGLAGRQALLSKWRRLYPADEFHPTRTFPPSLARMDLEDLPDHARDALGGERVEQGVAMRDLGVRENRPTYKGESRVPGAPHLFSALERRIEAAPFEKGTAEQWAAHLKTGVSAGERETTGIDRYLAEKAGKGITKQEMRDQFKTGHIRLDERTLGAPETMPHEQLTWAKHEAANGDEEWRPYSDRDSRLLREIRILHHPGRVPPYFLHSTIGGSDVFRTLEEAQARGQRLYEQNMPPREGTAHNRPRYAEYKEPGGTNYREILVKLSTSAKPFESGHFPQDKNLLGHLRVDDREYKGEKVLFAEEFQSDWHQKGRKYGYDRGPIKRADIEVKKIPSAPDRELEDPGDTGEGYWETFYRPTGEMIARHPGDMPREQAIEEAIMLGVRQNTAMVPDAPFKKTEEWLGLLMKRLMDEAVRGNYERVAWTNGDQQAARYDLSQHVDRLAYEPSGGNLQAWKGGRKIHEGRYDPRALEDVIGKEAAEKLLAQPKNGGNYHVLEGVDLKIGGQGMKAFYDKMAPKVAQQIGKELGVKLELEHIPLFKAPPAHKAGAPLTEREVREFGHDHESAGVGELIEDVANRMDEDTDWHTALDMLDQAHLGYASSDIAEARDFLNGMEEANPQRVAEGPRGPMLTMDDVIAVQMRAAPTEVANLLGDIIVEMEQNGTPWEAALQQIEDDVADGKRHGYENQSRTIAQAMDLLEDAEIEKDNERSRINGVVPSFKVTPELKAAAGKGMRMMERGPDLFGGGEPEQESLLPEGAGRSVPQSAPGGFSAKQREAKEKADFLRKQLPRVTDPEKRARVAAEIASLDRIANFTEKVKPAELQARAEAEKPIEGKPDTGTIDLFGERRARLSRDPDQQHLELTFGSVEKARAAVADLVENSGDYVTIPGGGLRTISGKDRLWNLKLWEKRDSLFQLEQRDELHPSAWVTIKGARVATSRDVAKLLHPFRSPRFERLHFVLLDANDTVVGHQIDTSGALNYVGFDAGYVQRILDAAKITGAKRVVLAHNHPSGDPTPSEEDRRMTVLVEQQLRGTGIELREHIVIDHRTFSEIVSRPIRVTDAGERPGSTVDQALAIPVTPDYEKDWTQAHGVRLASNQDVAALVRVNSPLKKGFAVIYLSTQHEAIALEPHGTAALNNVEKWLPERVKDLAASAVIIAHEKDLRLPISAPNGKMISQAAMHYLHDKAYENVELGRVLLDVMAFDGTENAGLVYGNPITGHRDYSEEEPTPSRRILETGAPDAKALPAARDEGDGPRSLTYGYLPPAEFGAGTLPRVGEPPPPAGGGSPPRKPPKGRAVAKLPDEEPQGGVFGALRKSLAPAGRTGQSAITARALRESNARLAHQNELAVEKLKKYRKAMNRLTVPERYDWIDAVETGQLHRIKDPELRTAAQLVRTLLDTARDEVIALGTGKLENWIENYFPHIWKQGDPGIIGKILGRRPFAGPKSFLKQRTIPTTKEGLAAGLEPVTDNPFDLALLRLREMNRYVAAHRFIAELKDRNLIQYVKAGTQPPEGYAQIDDKIGTVFGKAEVKLPNNAGTVHLGGILIRGAYYGPEPVVTVINNYLAPGLRGNPLYDAYAGIGNVLNQSQLGISAFHLGFTTADATISNMALAIEQLAAGQFRQGAFRLLATPAAPFTTFLKGHRMYAEYFNPQNNQMAALIDAVTAGGGRVRMDSFYRTNYLSKFLEELKHKDPKAALHLYPAFLELVSKPILEWIVPQQKLGVFAQLAEFEMSRLPAGASRDDVRRVMAEAWDAVDNRMGQLVYDNLFWKRSLKDAAMGSFRSVGWNIGTFRTVGTGFLDIGKIPFEAVKNRQAPKMSRDLAYVMGLTFFVILADSILNYFMTGKMAKGRDFFAPQTGKRNDEGNPDRVVLPTYMKDVIGYAQHPWETVKHKLNPAIEAVDEMLENKDFYGVQIRNPDDPIMKQLRQELTFFVHLIEPFGVRNAQEQKKRGQTLGVRAANYVGITPANRAMTRTAAQNKIAEFLGMESPSMTTPEQKEQTQARHDLRAAKAEHKPLGEARADARAAGLSRAQIQKTVRELPTGDIWLDRFKKLTYPQMKIVFDVATDEEKRRWRFRLVEKRRAYEREHGHHATP